MARQLRAVSNDETAEAEKPEEAKTVADASAGGNRRELLVALRARIARSIDDPKTPARDLAALANRQLEIAREIETIDAANPPKKTTKQDDEVDDTYDASAV